MLRPEHANEAADHIAKCLEDLIKHGQMGRAIQEVDAEGRIALAGMPEDWRLIIRALRFYAASGLLVGSNH